MAKKLPNFSTVLNPSTLEIPLVSLPPLVTLYAMEKAVSVYAEFLRSRSLPVPRLHVVLGSGFGAALNKSSFELVGELPFAEVPGLFSSTVPDHAGAYRFYRWRDSVISFQMGRLHGYEGHAAREVVRPVMIPRLAGVSEFLLTNASGGLAPHFRAGDVMLIRDHVNLTGQNPLVGKNPAGPDGAELGPRFPDLGRLYDGDWRRRLHRHCRARGLRVHEGVYLGILGPSFETPAEVQLFASWGLHAVGMSTVWEAIALKHAGARLAGISLVSNPAAGLGEGELDHLVILDTCRASAARIVGAIEDFVGEIYV
jgi:purine-nucleoside phosphorylase